VNGLELHGVSKRYGRGRLVLHRVDLAIAPGEVVGVVGGNGSGKSTLLKVIVGLTSPTGGTMTGRPEVIGYVPERFPTAGRMSALSYLKHMGRIRGLSTGAAAGRARTLLGRLALVGGPDTQLRQLSKGNAQKVALAQALLVPPELLVLDEPWSGLDADAHEVLADLIDEAARAGAAVVFTDHREAIVAANATAVYRVVEGQLARQRVAAEPARRPPRRDVAVVELVPLTPVPDEPDWLRLPGVLDARRESSSVVIEIDGDRCDGLLVDAIKNGWSVEAVRRGAAGRTGPRRGDAR
jgi:ABC-type multidrug transport system ATPase subunit